MNEVGLRQSTLIEEQKRSNNIETKVKENDFIKLDEYLPIVERNS